MLSKKKVQERIIFVFRHRETLSLEDLAFDWNVTVDAVKRFMANHDLPHLPLRHKDAPYRKIKKKGVGRVRKSRIKTRLGIRYTDFELPYLGKYRSAIDYVLMSKFS